MELLTLKEAIGRYKIGNTSMRKYAKEAGVVIKIGRSWRLDPNKFEKWLESKCN